MKSPAQSRRIRIAWFSRLNLNSCGSAPSAYFTDRLLPTLNGLFDIDLFHDGFAGHPACPTYHYLTAVSRHRAEPYDIFFYQLENSRESYFSRIHLGLVPGVVLFHDLLFSDDGPEPILNSPWSAVADKFHHRDLGWPDRKMAFKREGPLGYREAGMAVVPVFVSEKDHAEYRRMIKRRLTRDAGLSFYLPYPVDAGLARLAERPKKSPQRLHVLYCGTPRLEHRAHKILCAVAELGKKIRLTWLVADRKEQEQAARLVGEFAAGPVDFLTGRSPEKWAALLEEGDAALHTLFSVFGHAGPYLEMSLLAGLPCLVSDFGDSDYLPDKFVFKIEPGDAESSQIVEVLRSLAEDAVTVDRAAISGYAREKNDARSVAQELARIFSGVGPYLRAFYEEWESYAQEARRAVLEEISPFIEGRAGARLTDPVFRELGWL